MTRTIGGHTMDGYDVAGSYQPRFNWEASRTAGDELAAFKATQGTTFKDSWMAWNRIVTEELGFRYRGIYAWITPGLDIADQLAFFVSVIGELRLGEFIQLDEEQSPLTIDECVLACQLFSQRYPGRVAHYGGASFDGFGHVHPRLRSWPWWMAAYRAEIPPEAFAPTIWQWGGSHVDGIAKDVDSNQIINRASLETLAGYTSQPVPQPLQPSEDLMAMTAIGSACQRQAVTNRMQHYRAVQNPDGTVTVLGMNGAPITSPTGAPAFGNAVYTIGHQTTEFLGLVPAKDHGGVIACYGQGVTIDIVA